jgi:site-specific DNA recombinase
MKGVLYLRSSKDRNDVSIAAQRRELTALAAKRGMQIVDEFADAVESAKTGDRPEFQRLNNAIRSSSRGWKTVLVLDHSRVARDRLVAHAFRYECRKHDVDVVYAKMPDVDPISAVLLESVFEAFAEVHSLMSRDKGLSGMAENVRQGWRAGGRAPVGYKLEYVDTGTVRDGQPVRKSRLILSDDAPAIQRYLKARAAGEPRAQLARALPWAPNSLVSVEWNALTYAGHTVWNQHAPKSERGKGKPRRRPREEWVINRDTHPALITDAEAETLIAALVTSKIGKAVSWAKTAGSQFLLAGVLTTSDGRQWVGAGSRYRLKPAQGQPGRYIDRDLIEKVVLEKVTQDMQDETFIEALTKAARDSGLAQDPAKPLRDELADLERQKDKAARLALSTDDDGAFVKLVEDCSRQIQALKHQIEAVGIDGSIARELRRLTPETVRQLLTELGSPKAAVRAMVHSVVLDPDLTAFRVRYCSPNVASPRGFEPLSPP